MKHRDSSIVAYYNKIDRVIYCRLCISKNVRTSIVFRNTCNTMICCSYGTHPNKHSGNFHFNNTKHDIVISESECRMCSYHEGNCLVKRGYTCPFNIPEYTKDFANKIDHLKKE